MFGNPFKVRVREHRQAKNPALVSPYGSGFEGGTTGNTLLLPLVSGKVGGGCGSLGISTLVVEVPWDTHCCEFSWKPPF